MINASALACGRRKRPDRRSGDVHSRHQRLAAAQTSISLTALHRHRQNLNVSTRIIMLPCIILPLTRPCWRNVSAIVRRWRHIGVDFFMAVSRHTASRATNDIGQRWHRRPVADNNNLDGLFTCTPRHMRGEKELLSLLRLRNLFICQHVVLVNCRQYRVPHSAGKALINSIC